MSYAKYYLKAQKRELMDNLSGRKVLKEYLEENSPSRVYEICMQEAAEQDFNGQTYEDENNFNSGSSISDEPTRIIAVHAEPVGDAGAGSQFDTELVSVKGKTSKSRPKGGQDKLRTSHFIEWLNQNKTDANKTHKWIDFELRRDKPGLWGKNIETFNTWLKTDEAKDAKELLVKLKLAARQTGAIAKK